MGSVEFRIEVYHHDSDSWRDWSYGCPELGLMGYTNPLELLADCIKVISLNSHSTKSEGEK